MRLPARLPLLALLSACSASPQPRALRICADPNNLPYSDRRLEGFENRIAGLIAADLRLPLRYTWWPHRPGFLRNTLDAGACDVIMGAPAGYDRLSLTLPYYRSTYVFLSRRDRGIELHSFDDAALRSLRIGVQLIGADAESTPPVHALSRRGIIRNVVGYLVYGDQSRANPLSNIVDAVAGGEVDVAIVWGPPAGYFATRETVPLRLDAIAASDEDGDLPQAFDIAIGVRRGNDALRTAIDGVLLRRRAEIDRILDQFGVPRIEREPDPPLVQVQIALAR
jgi:mxaJ protein